jgi:hypothetical protein
MPTPFLEKPETTCTFAAHQRISSLKIPDMSDHIENEGKKGKTVMWIFIYIVLFIFLLIYLYQYNFKMTF